MGEARIPALAVDENEAAYLCRLSPDVFSAHYDGPWCRFGRLKRVRVEDLNAWLERVAKGKSTLPAKPPKDDWDALIDDGEGSRRQAS